MYIKLAFPHLIRRTSELSSGRFKSNKQNGNLFTIFHFLLTMPFKILFFFIYVFCYEFHDIF